MWETRDPGIVVTTPEEAVILASIVEKETGRADERPLHRERVPEPDQTKNMRLQSDPTIIYGLVGGKGALDHPIQQDELDRDTAYNTYKINGLPPTPIANPGRAAIEAVLQAGQDQGPLFRRRRHRRSCLRGRRSMSTIRMSSSGGRSSARSAPRRPQAAAAKAAQDAAAGGALDTRRVAGRCRPSSPRWRCRRLPARQSPKPLPGAPGR